MLLDQATLKKSAEADPQIAQFMAANPLPPPQWEDAHVMRSRLADLGAMMANMIGPPEAAIIEESKDIPMRDGFVSSIKVHRPAQPPPSGSPLMVLYFGGGWISGDKDLCTPAARAWVRLFGATVVAPAYRLGPEHKFPTSQYDAWDALKWVDEHASELGADPSQGFIVAGVSAGASNTAVVVTHAIENPLRHSITGQYMDVPTLFNEASVPEKYKPYFLALDQNKDAPILPSSAFVALEKHLEWDTKSPWRYPVHSSAPLSKQPPAYIQVDGMDPLRDDALIWDEMLKEAGVKTRLDFYPGCPHAHSAFFPGIEISNRAIADQMVGVGWLLGKTVTHQQGLAAMAPSA